MPTSLLLPFVTRSFTLSSNGTNEWVYTTGAEFVYAETIAYANIQQV